MNRPLPRRTLLRGVGLGSIAIGVPVLEAMLNTNGDRLRTARAQATRPLNFLTFFLPNGMNVTDFWPLAEGEGYTLTRCLEPLGHLKSEFSILQNLMKDEAHRNQDINNDAHDRGHASFATGGCLSGNTTVEGPSAEQVAAAELGGDTKFRSLPVALSGIGSSTNQANFLSWTSRSTPVPPDNDPLVLFNRVFGDPSGEGDPNRPLAKYRKSVLDYVLTELSDVQSRVGSADKKTLEQYVNSIREVEKQLEPSRHQISCQAPSAVNPELGGRPRSVDNGNGHYSNERARVLIWLQVTAVACGLTHFGSFMLSGRRNKRQFPWLGVPLDGDGHHGISHDSSPTGLEYQSRIVVDEIQQFAYMLDLMQSIQQGDRSLLYNSIVFFANECGHGEGHDFTNTPVIIAGRAGGQLRTGQHIKYERLTPYSNAFVSILQMLGINVDKFGFYGVGPLPRLAA